MKVPKSEMDRIISLADVWGVPVKYAERIYRWHKEVLEPYKWVLRELVSRGIVKEEQIQQLWREFWDRKIEEIEEMRRMLREARKK